MPTSARLGRGAAPTAPGVPPVVPEPGRLRWWEPRGQLDFSRVLRRRPRSLSRFCRHFSKRPPVPPHPPRPKGGGGLVFFFATVFPLPRLGGVRPRTAEPAFSAAVLIPNCRAADTPPRSEMFAPRIFPQTSSAGLCPGPPADICACA